MLSGAFSRSAQKIGEGLGRFTVKTRFILQWLLVLLFDVTHRLQWKGSVA
ncbi:hypothetical protein [Paenibacillus turpanensis]|nr:hypothetical protein [Paenibacillus turpanensis]